MDFLQGVVVPILLIIHITGYSLFIGGWFMGGLWKVAADRAGDPKHIAVSLRQLARFETRILIPLGFVAFFGGYIIVQFIDNVRVTDNAWTTLGMLFWFAGMAVWWFGMRRREDRMIVAAEAAAESGESLGAEYATNAGIWLLYDALAVLFPILGVVVMVLHPLGWAFL